MWSKDKIQHQKEYFAEQRKNSTGKFTEFVVRTYYCIYKNCAIHKSNYCLASEVNNQKIKFNIYEGFYNNQPDHDYNSVINDCKKYLIEMGYIHLENHNDRETIYLDKSLDFLLSGEHESYLVKNNVTEKLEPQRFVDVSIHPVRNQKEATDLINHMINPQQCPDSFEKDITMSPPLKKATNIKCESCGGHYIYRNGKFGDFLGCSNYPKCKSTKSIADITYSPLARHGINIYEIEVPCWKCGKTIKLRSYFPQIDLLISQPDLANIFDLYTIRLSVIDTLDQYLSKKYKEIYMKSSKRAGFPYMANNCSYCDSLQGSQLTLEKMYHTLLNTLENQTLSNYIVETIAVNEASLPKSEWKEVIDQVMKL